MIEVKQPKPTTHYSNFYVEFYVRQQKNFENCMIGNEIVVKPVRIIALSDTRITDIRKFVFLQVKDKFQLILAKNIELAYRVQVSTP
jgi:hypothetical protein